MDNLEFDETETETETLTCLALAALWDDPDNNNFDCPWDWRKELTNNEWAIYHPQPSG